MRESLRQTFVNEFCEMGLATVHHSEYLERLERLAAGENVQDFYLWPRTPIEKIQTKIEQRVGATDYQVQKPISRPAIIITFLKKLCQSEMLPQNFSVLDIACGDGIVLWQIQKSFPQSACYGVDCNKGQFSAHSMVEGEGVRLYKAYIQHLFKNDSEQPFDVVLMLNTYRDWKAADLRGHEIDLPGLANRWFERNGIYVILTTGREGCNQLKQLGFAIKTLGKGEDRSDLVCASKRKLPGAAFAEVFRRWGKWGYPKVKTN
jgi:hypothetical protein